MAQAAYMDDVGVVERRWINEQSTITDLEPNQDAQDYNEAVEDASVTNPYSCAVSICPSAPLSLFSLIT
jgi:hypothetical protein